MKTKINTVILLLAITTLCVSCTKSIYADIVIKNGIVYDGESVNPLLVSIAIKNEKIVFIGNEKQSKIVASKTIDASGLIVCPGFIDPHTHADRELIDAEKSHNLPFLMQGVTTVGVGNDGESYFPTSKYNTLYEKQGIGTNAVLFTGQGTIRNEVIGSINREATEQEIKKMQDLVQQEMNQGSFGMSTGLFYAPGSYATTDEVISLAKIVAKNKGIYDTHLRDESSYSIGLIPSIKEAIEVGRQAKLPIHISHIKCLGVDVWHQSGEIIKLIEDVRKEGIEVTANQYPYDASATGLKAATVPRWAESGGKDSLFIRYNNPKLKNQILEETKMNIVRRGGPEKLLIVKINEPEFLGKNLLEISEMLHLPSEQAVFEILKTNSPTIASFNMIDTDISNFMKQPWVVTGSDGNTGHPRKYGAFPRKYNKYVKQDKIIDLATFINGSSSKTAEILRISDRGKLKKGYYADVIIFNPETFKDKADYIDAFQYTEGLQYSIINGKISVENGLPTQLLNGKVLKK